MSKVNLSTTEELIIELQKVRENPEIAVNTRAFAASLLGHYMEFKSLTYKQDQAARNLIASLSKAKAKRTRRKVETHYLYALKAGDMIKLGYSNNVSRRIKDMQTGNPEKIEKLWSTPCGKSIQVAKSNEKKLHRLCKKYKVRGEWFSMECMSLVSGFKPRLAKGE